MKASFRLLYRQLLSILCCCLLVTALTGIGMGLNNHLIRLPVQVLDVLINLHQGAFLADQIEPIYILILGLGVFALGFKIIVEGKYNLLFQSVPLIVANICRIIALILVIPLAVCVETGVAYRLGTDWFGMSNSEVAAFLSVHGGSSWGMQLAVLYILGVGIALVTLLILSWKSDKIPRQKIQQTLQKQPKKTPSRNNSAKKLSWSKRNKQTIICIYALIAILGILYYATSTWFVAIVIMLIVTIVSVVILGKNLIDSWQQQRSLTIPHEPEAESITMLKAIPDLMLRMSQDGICLSYMPAKEATSFILYGNIVNKHIREFLAPDIAEQFIISAQSSLQTGSTNIYCFPTIVDNVEQYHEARISPIGETEVLILVREIPDFERTSMVAQQLLSVDEPPAIDLLTESELIQLLKSRLSGNESKDCILLCLAIYTENSRNDALIIDDNLILQIAAQINSLLPSSIISHLDTYNLIVLVSDRTMETASVLVDDLYRNLNQLFATWQNDSYSIKFNIALLEVDADNSDVNALIDTAKMTCQMARQKVNFKTFW